MLLYTQIYAYIDVFWLAFDLILYHCSLQQGESPTTPRELRKTAKCKRNIGQTLQQSVSESNLEVQSNKDGRRVFKAATKKNDVENMLEKFYSFFSS